MGGSRLLLEQRSRRDAPFTLDTSAHNYIEPVKTLAPTYSAIKGHLSNCCLQRLCDHRNPPKPLTVASGTPFRPISVPVAFELDAIYRHYDSRICIPINRESAAVHPSPPSFPAILPCRGIIPWTLALAVAPATAISPCNLVMLSSLDTPDNPEISSSVERCQQEESDGRPLQFLLFVRAWENKLKRWVFSGRFIGPLFSTIGLN